MFMRLSQAPVVSLVLAIAGVLTGCNPPAGDRTAGSAPKTPAAAPADDGYNPHDVPITEEQKSKLRDETARFPAAVTKITELRDATEKETSHGIPENPYLAHQALDRADLVLQWLPEIARNSGVSKEHWEEINTTANELRTLFERVHQNIDSKQDPNFAGVADEIGKKVTRLQEIVQSQPSSASDEG